MQFTEGDLLLQLRLFELEAALSHARLSERSGLRILELGAGTGHQAAQLSQRGFKVDAIDLASSPYAQSQVFPVTTFDGRHIPFPDGTFDVVFSSNVLEHVTDLDELLREIVRVLKPAGLSLHLMPTSAWRFWSLLSHFGWLVKRSFQAATGKGAAVADELGRTRSTTTWRSALASIVPHRHGEHGTAVGEIFTYRRARWIGELTRAGMEHLGDRPTGLFYTNSLLFGRLLSLRMRRRIALIAGSACRIYSFRRS